MNQLPGHIHDLFISYARADLGWVYGYLLPALGLPPDRVVTAQDFAHGVSVVSEFERAVQDSRFTVLVYSPAFPANEWTDFSEQLASHLSVEEQRERVVLLLLQPCEVPLRLKPRLHLDCTEPADWEQQVAQLRQMLTLPEPNPEDIPCPYPGMAPFRQEDAQRFFGREDEIQELRQRLDEQSLILVMGPSGSGKSSLLSAGLIPALDERWTCITLRPGPKPIDTLQSTIAEVEGTDEPVADGIAPPKQPGKRVLLVVDQLEELFVQATKEDQVAFIDTISRLHQRRGWAVILALRADFFDDLMNSKLWPIAQPHRMELTPLRGQALQVAIQRPANDLKVHLEAGLVERLIADAADEPGALPLLQQTMVLLWEKRQRRLLPLNAYRAMGDGQRSGLATAVTTKADEALARLTPEDQVVAQRILVRLVQFGEGRPDTRRQQAIPAILDADGDRDRVLRVVQHLAQYRLLTLGEKNGEQQTVDIAHDVLITSWPAFGDWLKQWRAAELTRRRLQTKAEEWDRWVASKQPNAGLLDAAELAEAEQWLGSDEASTLGSSRTLQTLVSVSRAAIKKSARIRVGVIGALITLLIAVLAAITIGQSQLATQRGQAAATAESLAQAESYARGTAEREAIIRTTAEANARRSAQAEATAAADAKQKQMEAEREVVIRTTAEANARRSAQAEATAAANAKLKQAEAEAQSRRALAENLAGQSQLLIRVDNSPGDLALILARDAALTDGSVNTDQALRFALESTHRQWSIRSTSYRHEGAVYSVAFDPFGEMVVSCGADGTIRFWRGAALKPLPYLFGHAGGVRSVAFSPDGKLIVSGGEDGTVRLWDVLKGEQLAQLDGHGGIVNSVAFSPDGERIISGGEDGTVRLWDATSGKQLILISSQENMVYSVAFSPDGKRIAWNSYDGVQLSDATSGEQLAELGSLAEWMNSVAFSPDGKHIVSNGNDGMELSDATSGERLVQIGQHEFSVPSLAFSPDGRRIVSGSDTVRLWDSTTGEQLAQLDGHAGSVNSVAFSPNGERIVSGGQDGTVRLWDAVTGEQLVQPDGHVGSVNSVAFSPDGNRIVSGSGHVVGSSDNTVRLWDAASGEQLVQLAGHEESVTSVAFSPDGIRIVSGSLDNTVRLWDSASGKQLLRLDGHSDWVHSVAFSPNGKRIVSGGGDGTVRLWDSTTGEQLAQLDGHVGSARSVTFSPNGERIVSGGDTVRLWDATTGEQLTLLEGHEAGVASVAFSPDSKRIVSGSWDGTVRLWDSINSRQLIQLDTQGGTVWSVDFSPDGRYIVSGSDDGAVRLWDATSGQQLAKITGHAESVNSVAFSPNGERIVSGGDTVRLWDAISNDELVRLDGHIGSAKSVVFSPDGERIVSGGDTVRLWDATSGKQLVQLDGHGGIVNSVAFSPDGERIISGGEDGTARLWDVTSGKQLIQLSAQMGWVSVVAFSPDGRRIISGGHDGKVQLWDATTGEQLAPLAGHVASVKIAVFSPDGERIASAGGNDTGIVANSVVLWNTTTGERLVQLDSRAGRVYSLAFSPNGERIVSGGGDGTVRLWDAVTGEQMAQLDGHTGSVYSVAFSPNGERIISGGEDGTVRLWDTTSGEQLAQLNGHTGRVWTVTFSPDGERIVSGGEDGVRLWDGTQRILLRAIARISRPAPILTSAERKRFGIGREVKLPDQEMLRPLLVRAQALRLVEQGRELARTGAVAEAVVHFYQAFALDPMLAIEPKTLAQRVLRNQVRSLLFTGHNQARRGDMTGAITRFEEATILDPSLTTNPDAAQDWNGLCQAGVLWNQAPLVLDACDTAVRLAPNDRNTRDSRGVARALAGNIQGAVEDFELALEQAKAKGESDGFIASRSAWVKALQEGLDPASIFDEATLEKLRNEDSDW